MTPLDRASARLEVLANMMALVHQQAYSRCGLVAKSASAQALASLLK